MKTNQNFLTLNSILARIEQMLLSAVIGLVFPSLLGLVGWWGSIPLAPEASIPWFALGGVLLGVLVDILFLERWKRNALHLRLVYPVLVYLFYSLAMFGFFMAVPVFNVVMGPLGGYYMGMRLRTQNAQKKAVQCTAKLTGIFSALVLAAICGAALIIAALDPSLEANISGMFNLVTPPGKTAILALSTFAGAGLVAIEYVLTKAAVQFARFEN